MSSSIQLVRFRRRPSHDVAGHFPGFLPGDLGGPAIGHLYREAPPVAHRHVNGVAELVPSVDGDRTGAGLTDGQAHLVEQIVGDASAAGNRGGHHPYRPYVGRVRRERHAHGRHGRWGGVHEGVLA
jgi:hypothetical protein